MDMHLHTDNNRIPLQDQARKGIQNEIGRSGHKYKKNVYGATNKNKGGFVKEQETVVET
jgi:hypothetical protein